MNAVADDAGAEVTRLLYRNPRHPTLGLEVLRLQDVHARVSSRAFRAHQRLSFYQLVYVTAGTGEFMVDFVPYRCRPGTLGFLRPGQISRLPLSHDESPIDALIVLFTGDFAHAPGSAGDLLKNRFGPVQWDLDGVVRDRVGRALTELDLAYHEPPEATDPALLVHLLAVALLRVARLDSGREEPVIANEVFQRFRERLESHYTTTRSVQNYARALGYSVRTLARASIAAIGRTPKQMIDDRVVLEAKRQLIRSDLTAAAVGRSLGFDDPAGFAKFFHRHTGLTPSAFRASTQQFHAGAGPVGSHAP